MGREMTLVSDDLRHVETSYSWSSWDQTHHHQKHTLLQHGAAWEKTGFHVSSLPTWILCISSCIFRGLGGLKPTPHVGRLVFFKIIPSAHAKFSHSFHPHEKKQQQTVEWCHMLPNQQAAVNVTAPPCWLTRSIDKTSLSDLAFMYCMFGPAKTPVSNVNTSTLPLFWRNSEEGLVPS